MINVKGNNKRGASVAFVTQLIDDRVQQEVSNSISSTTLTPTNLTIQNSNFGASTSRNLTHPVLVTNSYGTGVSVTPDQYSSSALALQCKANETYVLVCLRSLTMCPKLLSMSDLSDRQIECNKALFL